MFWVSCHRLLQKEVELYIKHKINVNRSTYLLLFFKMTFIIFPEKGALVQKKVYTLSSVYNTFYYGIPLYYKERSQ